GLKCDGQHITVIRFNVGLKCDGQHITVIRFNVGLIFRVTRFPTAGFIIAVKNRYTHRPAN
ncbi:MAG: hypothetical protein QMB37_03840, partial [Paludibacteraceae bacterium]|uniref:hypothetical protein n=1 Tax=Macellibacteroides fermentans TaxID=879969 RepID=UPI00352C16B5